VSYNGLHWWLNVCNEQLQTQSDVRVSLCLGMGVVDTKCTQTISNKRMRAKARQEVFAASKLVVMARERAEARFVIEYTQLVNTRSMSEFQDTVRELEVPRTAVSVAAELGRGQAGVVFAGTLLETGVKVAIKTRVNSVGCLVGEAATVADEALLLEALVLKGLQHPGIIKLLAVVTRTVPLLICTELMPNGDLRNFLRTCRRLKLGSQVAPVVTPQVMLAMCATLASAMAYLERLSIIHRDVAARNVLVGTEPTSVKLADLGAARNVHRSNESSYRGVYTATTDHNPARWMPLEALREAKFSHKSDVFAFGVLVWEILSLGRTPWGAFGVQDFTEALGRGDRLQLDVDQTEASAQQFPSSGTGGDVGHTPRESTVIKTIYAIALRCWSEVPRKRPHFHQLESDFAIHLTVSKAETRRDNAGGCIDDSVVVAVASATIGAGRVRNPRLDANGYVNDTLAATNAGFNEVPGCANPSMMDTDGYVDDCSTSVPPILASTITANAAVSTSSLDAGGYVQDKTLSENHVPVLISASAPNEVPGCAKPSMLDTDGYVEDCSTSVPPILASTITANAAVPTSSLDAGGYVQDKTLPDDHFPVLIPASAQERLRQGDTVTVEKQGRGIRGMGQASLSVHANEFDSESRLHPDETRL
jgi:serine/threonine protein kinase